MTVGQIETIMDHLTGDASPEARVAAAKRVASDYSRHDLNPARRTLAVDAFRLLMQDDSAQVRRALAEGLRDDPMVPHDVVWLMANDVADVALPILNHSIVLADDDLIEIIRSATQAHRLAIARRDTVSARVVHALCEVRNEAIAMTLVRNAGADVDEAAFARLLADYTASSPVVEAATDHQFLILRRSLAERSMPPALAERLVHRIAEKLKVQVEAHPHLRAAAAKLVSNARERATLALVPDHIEPAARRDFVRHLGTNRRLTASLIVRCVAEGHFELAAAGIAWVSGFDEASVRAALDQGPQGGLAVILQATRIQNDARVAIETCATAARSASDRDDYRRRVLQAFGTDDADTGALLKRLAIAPVPLSPATSA